MNDESITPAGGSDFESEFAKMVAEDTGAPAVAAPVDASTVIPPVPATAKPPKPPKPPKQPEGPNPYGIHLGNGEVVTMTYLRKWAQCATRGMTNKRAENINHLMSPAFLETCRGISTGEYSARCFNYDGWYDEANPRQGTKVSRGSAPKAPKPAKQPKTKGKKSETGKATPDVAQAAADEQALLQQAASAEIAPPVDASTPAY